MSKSITVGLRHPIWAQRGDSGRARGQGRQGADHRTARQQRPVHGPARAFRGALERQGDQPHRFRPSLTPPLTLPSEALRSRRRSLGLRLRGGGSGSPGVRALLDKGPGAAIITCGPNVPRRGRTHAVSRFGTRGDQGRRISGCHPGPGYEPGAPLSRALPAACRNREGNPPSRPGRNPRFPPAVPATLVGEPCSASYRLRTAMLF